VRLAGAWLALAPVAQASSAPAARLLELRSEARPRGLALDAAGGRL
jgi:hypothetical protein